MHSFWFIVFLAASATSGVYVDNLEITVDFDDNLCRIQVNETAVIRPHHQPISVFTRTIATPARDHEKPTIENVRIEFPGVRHEIHIVNTGDLTVVEVIFEAAVHEPFKYQLTYESRNAMRFDGAFTNVDWPLVPANGFAYVSRNASHAKPAGANVHLAGVFATLHKAFEVFPAGECVELSMDAEQTEVQCPAREISAGDTYSFRLLYNPSTTDTCPFDADLVAYRRFVTSLFILFLLFMGIGCIWCCFCEHKPLWVLWTEACCCCPLRCCEECCECGWACCRWYDEEEEEEPCASEKQPLLHPDRYPPAAVITPTCVPQQATSGLARSSMTAAAARTAFV
jgi:hypothetical protein